MSYNSIMRILIGLVILYFVLLYPNTRRKDRMKPYENKYIAHRGLYNNLDIPENSLLAFKKAVDNDYGIELDLQLTLDDKVVVFHDGSLERMTGIKKNLQYCTYKELQTYKLLDTDERIPLFEDVLKLLKTDTPLIIEIKPDGRYIETTKKTVEMMREYNGLYNIESFNPKVVKYLKDNEPDIIRGQLSYDYINDKEITMPFTFKVVMTYLLTNFYNSPDYIAYDCKNYKNISFRIISRLMKAECVAWTVQSQEELNRIKDYYQCFIFDSFIPEKKI